MIDFRELPDDGIAFEQLVRELLIREGFEVHWTGVGPDQGRDLIVIEQAKGSFYDFRRKWLVQCKHFAHSGKSVGINDVPSIIDNCGAVGAEGYLLICSTQPTSSLVTKFEEITANPNNRIVARYWDSIELEKHLYTPYGLPLIYQFLPKSAKNIKWMIYNMGSPSFWAANYKDYFIYLSSRIAVKFPNLKDLEKIINKLEFIPTPDDQYLRPRAIYFDEKHEQFIVFVDYIIPHDYEGYLSSKELNEYLKDGQGLYSDEVSMWYITYYDIRLIKENQLSDRFQVDNRVYYEPYIRNFEIGLFRNGHSLSEAIF